MVKAKPKKTKLCQNYSIVIYSKKIKKNTKDFNARDMVNYLRWLERKDNHTK